MAVMTTGTATDFNYLLTDQFYQCYFMLRYIAQSWSTLMLTRPRLCSYFEFEYVGALLCGLFLSASADFKHSSF